MRHNATGPRGGCFDFATAHGRAGRSGPRRSTLAAQAFRREGLGRALTGPALFVPGFAYTDRLYGHRGLAFGDVAAALAAVSPDEAVGRAAVETA